MDGSLCSSSICVEQSYLGGNLIFNVSHFTAYSVDETPVSTSPQTTSSGSGGGTGGSNPLITKSFVISKESMHIKLRQGMVEREILNIKNTGTQKITIKIDIQKIDNYIKINQAEIDLESGDSKDINFDFFTINSTNPDLYLGKIIFSSGNTKKEVLTALEIESNKPLFDVIVEIPEDYLKIAPEKELFTILKISNLGDSQRVDVNIQYIIKDINNNIITEKSDTNAVETQASFLKIFKLPKDIPAGKYFLYVKVNYLGNIASSSHEFSVVKPFGNNFYILAIIIVIFIILVTLYIIYKLLELNIKTRIKIELNKKMIK
jgi:uncharacterized membrane protein